MSANPKIIVIVSRWNELVTKALLDGAKSELEGAGYEPSQILHVPGAWEIPIICKRLLASQNVPDGIIALGCILQGETQHGRLLASDVSSALMRLQLDFGVPIAWGILTPDTPEQALDRAGLKMGNKGREAASSIIATLKTISSIQ